MSNQSLIKSNDIKDVVQSDAVKARLREIMGERGAAFGAALVQIVKQSSMLQKCAPTSVIGAALTAAALDLSIDPNLGEAYIIPYGDQAQFQIGFKGFIQLAMRSGEYKAFGSTVVHEGELVSYDELTGELIVDKKLKKSDTVIGYAAKFKLLNGFERGEFWTPDEIEAHASAYSKQYRYAKGKPDKEANCLWVTKRDEMAIKTVEKSLLNHYGPKSIQMKKAIKMDGGAVIDADAEDVSYIDNEVDAPKTTTPKFEATVEAPMPEATPMKSAKPVEVKKATPKVEQEINTPAVEMRKLITSAGLTVEKVIGFLQAIGSIGDEVSTIEELVIKSPDVFDMLKAQYSDIFEKIKTV